MRCWFFLPACLWLGRRAWLGVWRLWQENALLRENVLRFESDYQEAQATAERLENLEELLREDGVPGRELVLRKLASADQAQRLPLAVPESGARAADSADDAEDAARGTWAKGRGMMSFQPLTPAM